MDLDKLENLSRLRDAELLTQQEFEQLKKEALTPDVGITAEQVSTSETQAEENLFSVNKQQRGQWQWYALGLLAFAIAFGVLGWLIFGKLTPAPAKIAPSVALTRPANSSTVFESLDDLSGAQILSICQRADVISNLTEQLRQEMLNKNREATGDAASMNLDELAVLQALEGFNSARDFMNASYKMDKIQVALPLTAATPISPEGGIEASKDGKRLITVLCSASMHMKGKFPVVDKLDLDEVTYFVNFNDRGTNDLADKNFTITVKYFDFENASVNGTRPSTTSQYDEPSADWLIGSWRSPIEGDPSTGIAYCETDGKVTFKADGTYSDGGSYGNYSLANSQVTLSDIVLFDQAAEEGQQEDYSEFREAKTLKLVRVNQNVMLEDGEKLVRCK